MSLEEYCLKPSPSSQVKAVDNQRKNNVIFPEKAILTTEFYSKNSAKSLRLQKEVPISTKGILLSLELCALPVYFQHRLCCVYGSTEAVELFGKVL